MSTHLCNHLARMQTSSMLQQEAVAAAVLLRHMLYRRDLDGHSSAILPMLAGFLLRDEPRRTAPTCAK